MTNSLNSIYSVICVLIFVLGYHNSEAQVDVFNNGGLLKVNNSALFYVDGNYTNLNDGIQDGAIDLNGNFVLTHNWVNNSLSSVFTNVEPVPNGWVRMIGNNPLAFQRVQGTFPTSFENLDVSFERKILDNSDNAVKGTLRINAIFDLNANRFIIDNPSPSGIEYLSKNIRSETNPMTGYGIIQWNIGSSLNAYSVPFGSVNSSTRDLNLSIITQTSGQPADGFISFATYPSDQYNQPLPFGTTLFFDPVESVVDRYWHINPSYNTVKPSANIIFSYNNQDIDNNSNFNLNPARLKAMRYNPTIGRWDDWGPYGKANESSSTVLLAGTSSNPLGVPQNQFFNDWTLIAAEEILSEIYIPTAFSPNGDGFNDVFFPVFHPDTDIEAYEFHIFDRWGEKVFFTSDPNIGWNGTYKSDKTLPIAVFSYLIVLKSVGKGEKRYTGHITLLK
jgi:gliding motility-associated-like protein